VLKKKPEATTSKNPTTNSFCFMVMYIPQDH
jgi:hypothetical protein